MVHLHDGVQELLSLQPEGLVGLEDVGEVEGLGDVGHHVVHDLLLLAGRVFGGLGGHLLINQ